MSLSERVCTLHLRFPHHQHHKSHLDSTAAKKNGSAAGKKKKSGAKQAQAEELLRQKSNRAARLEKRNTARVIETTEGKSLDHAPRVEVAEPSTKPMMERHHVKPKQVYKSKGVLQ